MLEPSPSPPAAQRLRIGDCELHLDTREFWCGGERRHLRRRVFDLLACLVARGPQVVSHGELMQAVWRRGDVAHSLLARAIMEARRACGDAGGQVVCVHGVGYRFTGVASAGTPAPMVPASAEAMVQGAQAALQAQRPEEAQRLADEAVAMACMLGARALQVRALLVSAVASLQTGDLATAARQAGQALQVARTEGSPVLVAEVRLATGRLHVAVGDRETGVSHLEEALEELSAPGLEEHQAVALDLLAQALRAQGVPDRAMAARERRIALLAAAGDDAHADRIDQIRLRADLGDRCAEAGDAEEAQAHFEAGLRDARALLEHLPAPPHAAQRAACLALTSGLLDRLGRLEEASRHANACEALQAGPSLAPADRAHRHLLRARLLAREGLQEPALAQAEAALSAAESLPMDEGAAVQGLAADVAALCARHDLAATWQRRRCEMLVRDQRARIAASAAILGGELNAHVLQSELDSVYRQCADVEAENGELRRLQRRLEAGVTLLPHSGLAAPDQAERVFGPALERAQARGLPMCIGLLQLVQADLMPLAGRSPQREAVAALQAHADVAWPAVELAPGCIVFHVRDAGLVRAQAVCAELVDRLARQAGEGRSPASWAWAAVDAAGCARLADALRALRQPGEATALRRSQSIST